MVQGAVYDAVNSIAGEREPYLVDVPADGSESTAAAAATAAYRVLVSIVPGQQPMLEGRYARLDRRDPARPRRGTRASRSARPRPAR